MSNLLDRLEEHKTFPLAARDERLSPYSLRLVRELQDMVSKQNTLINWLVDKFDPYPWNDLDVALSSARRPAVNAPTWRNYDFEIVGGVAYEVLGFGVNDYIEFTVQTSHAMKLSTILDNHIHWSISGDDADDRFQFQLDVIAAAIDVAFAVPTGSPFTMEKVLVGNETGKHNYLDLAEIPAFNTTVSSLALCRLTRIAATQDEYTVGS